MLEENGLTVFRRVPVNKGTATARTHFQWSTPDGSLTLTTCNNPITGKYQDPKARSPEKGYASYMGITGTDSEAVITLANSIKKHAASIKGESPFDREFV